MKMATDCLTAVVAASGFFLWMLPLRTAIEVQKKRRKWKMWTKPWILQRPVAGAYNGSIMDLFNTDEISYKKTYCR